MKKYVTNLAGRNIYLDLYGNSVYYNFVDKKGYLITKEVDSKFKIFYHRYSIILIVLVLLGDYFDTLNTTLLVGVGATLLIEMYFRFIYLKQLKVVNNFKRDRRESKIDVIAKSKDKGKIIMKGIAYIVLSVLVVLNAIDQNFNMIFIALSIVIAVYSTYLGILNMIACKKIKRI